MTGEGKTFCDILLVGAEGSSGEEGWEGIEEELTKDEVEADESE
jgi:hypothetical protein